MCKIESFIDVHMFIMEKFRKDIGNYKWTSICYGIGKIIIYYLIENGNSNEWSINFNEITI